MSDTTEQTAAPAKKVRKPKKVAAKKSKKAPKAKKVSAGRPSAFSGKRITKLVRENPRRKGTVGHSSFGKITSGMSYEQYVAKGGRRQDLVFDIAHKYVKLSK